MNQPEAIREACSIVALAFHSIGDYRSPSDGFCDQCPNHHSTHYQNAGRTLKYVRLAVLKQLKRDGYKIHKGFNARTGKEKTSPTSPFNEK